MIAPALAWCGAFVVMAFTYLLLFAAGMKTAPRLDPGDALLAGVPLATAASLLLWGVVHNVRGQRFARAVAGYGLPLLGCLFFGLMLIGTLLS